MTGMTDFITESCWEDIFTLWFVLVDDAYQALQQHYGAWRRRGPAPLFSDSEVVTVALIIESWFQGDEAKGLAFLKQYHADLFPKLLAPGPFNERRRALRLIIEQIRRYLMAQFELIEPTAPYRIVDSVPVPVCAYGRASRNQTVTGPEYVGLVAANKSKFFGFRLQATITSEQLLDDWLLTPAGRKDGKMLTALLADSNNLVILGDNAYHDPGQSDLLARSRQITVWAVPRRDTRQPWPADFKPFVKRLRLRIETAFSVLTGVFNLQQPGSRSLSGLIARVSTKLLAYTLCFITAPWAAANSS